MVKMQFVILMENTEKEARRFFERNPSLMTSAALIAEAEKKGLLSDPAIDSDLFKHLMKKYHNIGY